MFNDDEKKIVKMIPIPEFPKYRKIELEDKPIFDDLFKKYHPLISDFTFTNLFTWRYAHKFHISNIGDFVLVISLKDNNWRIYDPIGPIEKKKEIIKRCFSLLPATDTVRFVMLLDIVAELFRRNSSYVIEEERNNFDYVYLTKNLIELKGKDYDSKRNFIKRFNEKYKYEYKRITKDDIEKCIFFEEEWCLNRDCFGIEGLEKERKAIKDMLVNFEYLKIKGGMLTINNKIEAVTLGEALNKETFVVHIEKANSDYIGSYQVINQMFCSAEAVNYKYVNREQDLGIPGLRNSKESYHPHKMIKKYTLALNQ